MDTARQLIRWGLPGWLLILYVVLYIAIGFIFHGRLEDLSLQESRFFFQTGESLLTLGALAIPGGFIIYQIYYATYWHFPLPFFLHSLNDPGDRGLDILKKVQETDWRVILNDGLQYPPNTSVDFYNQAPLSETIDDEYGAYQLKYFGIRFKDRRIMSRYQHNWDFKDTVWYLCLLNLGNDEIAKFLQHRLQFLADIYHSLGACQITVGLSCAFYLFLILLKPDAFLDTERGADSVLATVIAVILITGASYFLFRQGRQDSYGTLAALQRNVINYVVSDKKNVERFPQAATATTEGVAKTG